MTRIALVATVVAALALACGPGSKGGPTMNNHVTAPEATPQSSPVVSADILAREPLANHVQVKHILIGWKNTDAHDPRSENRTKADAEVEVKRLLDQLKAGADFDELMKTSSEDPGSASTARAYPVSPDAQLVIEFRQLALRLRIGEIGVVQTDFGLHIMKRIE
jgi:hypothetical protein